jgi:uncharacterized protein involved in type VI secretion and phage assembly
MASHRKISIATPLAEEQLLVRSATMTERLGEPFEKDVDLLSPNENIDFELLRAASPAADGAQYQ